MLNLQSKNQFLLMHDWKELLIALRYHSNRTQKLDSRKDKYFANLQLFF